MILTKMRLILMTYNLPDGFIFIKGFENRYSINKKGEIYSLLRNKIMKNTTLFIKNKYKTLTITLRCKDGNKNSYQVKKLIIENFKNKKIDSLLDIAHIDGKYLNCNIENLKLY